MIVRPRSSLSLAALLVHCASATTPRYDAAAALDASPPDAPLDAPLDAPPDAPPCHWAVGPAQLLTERTQDWALEGVAVGASGLLVGVQVSDADPPHDRAFRVQQVGFDAVPAAAGRVTAISQPDYVTGYAYLALTAQPRAGAVAWDEHRGMQFVPLSDEGLPTSPVRSIGGVQVASVDAFSNGYVVLSSDAMGTSLVSQVLDPSGAPTGETHTLAPFTLSGTYPEWRRSTLGDGTFALATLTGDAPSRVLSLSRYTIQGEMLGAAHTVSGFVATARLRLASHGAELWAGQVASDPRNVGVVLLQRADSNGVPIGMPVSLPSARPVSPYYWSLGWVGGQLLVVWFGGAMGAPNLLMMQTVSPALDVQGDPVQLDHIEGGFGNGVTLRDTPQGPVLVYEAEATRGEPMQVYARTLRCQ